MYSILYVDDVFENRLLIKSFLRQCDCELELVEDGQTALDRVAAGGLDLMLLDISMPGMSGDEVAQIIRQREQETGVEPMPLLAMSAYSDAELREKYPDAGFSGFVCKPVGRKELIDQLGKFLPGL